MSNLILFLVGIGLVIVGAIVGYYARQSLAKRREGSIEARLDRKIRETRKERDNMIAEAKKRANKIIEDSQKETENKRKEILKTERLLYQRENKLEKKIANFEEREKEFNKKLEKLKATKQNLQEREQEIQKKLENISGYSQSQAKEELFRQVEKDYNRELMERMRQLKEEGDKKFENEAKEILMGAIEKYAPSQAQEVTTTTIHLPSEKIKGRIIGKEGRNIRAFEKATGVEIVVDDTPDTVVISGFNPVRRHTAKLALEKLIKDGRIQPARIEEEVKNAKEKTEEEMEEFGNNALYEVGIVGIPKTLSKLLGRLHFRNSYGQNVLLHSIEVAHLAGNLAAELGGNVKAAKKAGLFHDIGKAVDQDMEGTHVDIGVKILEKFEQPKEIIDAMKAHHEEYEADTLEAVLVKVADQISGARPGVRKDTVENYLKRLEELEEIAQEFKGVEKAYAIQAGREIRVFVQPEEVGDLEAYKMAKDIAGRIHEQLTYPGEIKVNVIRETRVAEYAR